MLLLLLTLHDLKPRYNGVSSVVCHFVARSPLFQCNSLVPPYIFRFIWRLAVVSAAAAAIHHQQKIDIIYYMYVCIYLWKACLVKNAKNIAFGYNIPSIFDNKFNFLSEFCSIICFICITLLMLPWCILLKTILIVEWNF